MAELILSRTRKKNRPKLSEYIDLGKDIIVAELPTQRDLLRYGLF